MEAGATEEDVQKISQVMAQTVRKLETVGPEAHSLPCEVVGSDEEEPVKRHHRKEAIGEKCKQEGEVCSLLRLWIWTQLIAVPFHLALSRIGEADNPGPAQATAKLQKLENTDKWSASVLRKNPVLTPHRSVRTSKGTHSHVDRFPLPVSPEPEGDFCTHTQQFSDYLFLFQIGDGCDESRHVSAQMQICDRSGKERNDPFCHHAKRGGRKHTGKKRKLETAEGVVNILQCNVTTWSGHARHYILTSDFDAALISETYLGGEKLVTAANEARKFSWAGTGSAAISTANNGTSAGVLALVRTRWFSKPVSECTDETVFLCSNPRLARRVIRVMGREILMLTAYFEHSVVFRSDINAKLMQDVCCLTGDGKLPFILGADSNFPPSMKQDLSVHGDSL